MTEENTLEVTGAVPISLNILSMSTTIPLPRPDTPVSLGPGSDISDDDNSGVYVNEASFVGESYMGPNFFTVKKDIEYLQQDNKQTNKKIEEIYIRLADIDNGFDSIQKKVTGLDQSDEKLLQLHMKATQENKLALSNNRAERKQESIFVQSKLNKIMEDRKKDMLWFKRWSKQQAKGNFSQQLNITYVGTAIAVSFTIVTIMRWLDRK
jgi:hypothetical protein